MIDGAGKRRIVAMMAVCAVLAGGLAGCENGPSMEQLAPKMIKIRADVPESTHPESTSAEFPNINNAPDRESRTYEDKDIEKIENSLAEAGATHVKKTVSAITGDPLDDSDAEDGAAGSQDDG